LGLDGWNPICYNRCRRCGRMPRGERRTCRFQVSVTQGEKERLQDAAYAVRRSMAAWVREKALDYADAHVRAQAMLRAPVRKGGRGR